MSQTINAIFRSSLPDDVFDPGEKQKPILKRPIQKVSQLRYALPGSKHFSAVQGNGQNGQRISRLAEQAKKVGIKMIAPKFPFCPRRI